MFSLPVISAYVGADITAGILATRLHRSGEPVLLLDLGTVAKAVLYHEGRIAATSVPGGGAFECAGITVGMRPETGAIHSVTIGSDLQLGVVGESLARGICGSGLMELVSELKRVGMIDTQGDFLEAVASPRAAAHTVDRCPRRPHSLGVELPRPSDQKKASR